MRRSGWSSGVLKTPEALVDLRRELDLHLVTVNQITRPARRGGFCFWSGQPFVFSADASDFARLGQAFGRLPADIRAKAFFRAMRRVADMGLTRLVRRQSPRLKLPQKIIRERTKALAFGATADIVQRSNWIGLYKLGARQTGSGVTVKARGSYRHAFIATMRSGHTGVFMREGRARTPITELFGPNPAHDIVRNASVYEEVIEDVRDQVLVPRMLHELSRLLPR